MGTTQLANLFPQTTGMAPLKSAYPVSRVLSTAGLLTPPKVQWSFLSLSTHNLATLSVYVNDNRLQSGPLCCRSCFEYPAPTPSTVGGGQRSSAAVAYLQPALNRTNLHVLIENTVTKLVETSHSGGKPSFMKVEFAPSENGACFLARSLST